MIRQDSPRLVLNLETLRKLQPPAETELRSPQPTHPTTTVNTIHTGCC